MAADPLWREVASAAYARYEIDMTMGGFTLDAIRRARQFEKEMSRRKPGVRVRVRDRTGGAEKEDFACYLVCGSCGLLAEPPSMASHPDPGPHSQTCPHCHAAAWIDLRNINSALALRETEERLRHDPPTWIRNRVRAATGGVGLAVGGAAAIAMQVLFAPALGALAVASIATGGLGALASNSTLSRPLSRLLLARAPQGPARWRRALPIPNLESAVVERRRGVPRSADEPLIAPISGRACIAYEVAVIFDADGDAYPPMWVLREDCSHAFELDGIEIASDGVDLELPLEDVSQAALAKSEEEIKVFLRKRGLFHTDGKFDFFEAVLPAGAPCELVRYAEPEQSPWVVMSP